VTRAVAEQVTEQQLKQGMLYPPQANILETELYTAAKVAQVIFERGLARVDKPADVAKFIRQHAYAPAYAKLVD
jgi:malate dehydrogenase (oxaloacetate-decarboxylating)(NADP+)